MSELVIYYEGRPLLRETLESSLTLGSGPENDIRLVDSVAPNHARIEITSKQIVLVEKEGAIYSNGQKIPGSKILEDGDTFDVGPYRLQVLQSTRNTFVGNKTSTVDVASGKETPTHIMPLLQFLSPFKKRFRRPKIFLGREAINDIQANDPFVSTRHAEIFIHQGKYFIRDLHSRNGTFINDVPITEKELPSTGNIRLGRYTFTYQIGNPDPSSEEEFEGIKVPGVAPNAPERLIVGRSASFKTLMKKLKSIAPSHDSVMLVGETGVGKDMLAHFLHHENSGRRGHPFVIVNCATIPETLADSQLFGHVKGAFTGAVSDQKGFFQQAHRGTLFLDEISELSLESQARLLRVMEDGLVRPVMDSRQIPVDVRLVAATNRDLRTDCEQGKFRKDLFERFEWIIQVPPLRDRLEDLPILVQYFIRQHSPVPLTVGPEVLSFLASLRWDGNIRGLNKAVRRAITQAMTNHSDHLNISDFEEVIPQRPESTLPMPPTPTFKLKRARLSETLRAHKGNIQRVALALGISRQTIYNWLEEEKIPLEKIKE